MNTHARPGMSFIEIMVVVVIIGMLLRVVGPRVMKLLGRGKSTTAQTELRAFSNAITEYHLDTNQYPKELDDLVRKPEDERLQGWDGPYLSKKAIPLDPWGQEYNYKLNERGAQPPYELYSLNDPNKPNAQPVYAE